MLFVLVHHLCEIGGTLTIIVIGGTDHDLILQIVIFKLLIAMRKKMCERLHNPMCLTHGFNVMQSKSRIARAHLCNVPQFREFLPDRLHGEIPLHEVLLHVCVVIDTECLFECNIIVHESIDRDPRILLDLTRLTELVLIRHKVIDECLRTAQVLCEHTPLLRTLINVGANRACCMVGNNAHGGKSKIYGGRTELQRFRPHFLCICICPAIVSCLICLLHSIQLCTDQISIGIEKSRPRSDCRVCQIAPRINDRVRYRSFGEPLIPRLCIPCRLIRLLCGAFCCGGFSLFTLRASLI